MHNLLFSPPGRMRGSNHTGPLLIPRNLKLSWLSHEKRDLSIWHLKMREKKKIWERWGEKVKSAHATKHRYKKYIQNGFLMKIACSQRTLLSRSYLTPLLPWVSPRIDRIWGHGQHSAAVLGGFLLCPREHCWFTLLCPGHLEKAISCHTAQCFIPLLVQV